MSVIETVLFWFFIGCAWTYLILSATWPFESREGRENREHMRRMSGLFVVAISVGWVFAWVQEEISQSSEYARWLAEYPWLGVVVGGVTLFYLIFKGMPKTRADKERHRADLEGIRSRVQQWFDGLTSQQKDELGGMSRAVLQDQFLVALGTVARDWDFNHGHGRRFRDALLSDRPPLTVFPTTPPHT